MQTTTNQPTGPKQGIIRDPHHLILLLLLAPSPRRHRPQHRHYRRPRQLSASVLEGEFPVLTGGEARPSPDPRHRQAARWPYPGFSLASSNDHHRACAQTDLKLDDRRGRLPHPRPNLIERTVTVTAATDARYYLDFGWKVAVDCTFHSFTAKRRKPLRTPRVAAGPNSAAPRSRLSLPRRAPRRRSTASSATPPATGKTVPSWPSIGSRHLADQWRRLGETRHFHPHQSGRHQRLPRGIRRLAAHRGRRDPDLHHLDLLRARAVATTSSSPRTWRSPTRRASIPPRSKPSCATPPTFCSAATSSARERLHLHLRRRLRLETMGHRRLSTWRVALISRSMTWRRRRRCSSNASTTRTTPILPHLGRVSKRVSDELDMRTVDRAYNFIRAHERTGSSCHPPHAERENPPHLHGCAALRRRRRALLEPGLPLWRPLRRAKATKYRTPKSRPREWLP